jgi:hypothetical protein
VLDGNVIIDDVKSAQVVLARRLIGTDRFEAAEQQAVLSASSAGRSRTASVGHPRNLTLMPTEVWTWIGPYVNRTTARLVRTA